MTGPATGAGFLAEPGTVIAGIVAGAEPALGQDDVAAAIGGLPRRVLSSGGWPRR